MFSTESSDHCAKDALTGFLGWMLQGVLAGLAFTCLIAKRFREPPGIRRSWSVWWYDTSKQGIGAIVIHLTNVYLAPLFQGDPCTWYVINFLLDSTIGLLIVFIGIRLCQFLAHYKKWPAINFGVYDAPKSWIYQTTIYIGLMALIKLSTTLLIQWKFWESVKNLVLTPFSNATVELILFMLVIPFFVNLLIFWVTDNFLMRHEHHQHRRSFLIKYVDKFSRNNSMSNGTNTINHNGVNNGNGKCSTNRNTLLERAQIYCSQKLNRRFSENDHFYKLNVNDFSNFNEINDNESDALISGDERFDVELTDDDCVVLDRAFSN